jgi:hypothetical protein
MRLRWRGAEPLRDAPGRPQRQPRVAPRATKQAERPATQQIVQIRGGRETVYSSVDGRLAPAPGQPPSLAGTTEQAAERLKSLFLPDGYPGSVTDDYLEYQLWTVPAHISGWLSHSLTTSSLLKAVGIGAGPVGATAAAAAIKWILKDGIGAAGRYLVGGRLGLEFDADPRRWRMVAGAPALRPPLRRSAAPLHRCRAPPRGASGVQPAPHLVQSC